jgi:hypothetical protein
MEYSTIKIPMELNKPIEIMNRREIKKYFKWFMSIKDERMKYLMKRVFNSDEIVFSEQNIQALHYLMAENIYEGIKAEEEIAIEISQIPEDLKSSHKVKPKRLIEPTISIAIDIGIYFCEYLIHEVDDLKWDYEKDKEVDQYGRPVIKGKKKYCCPSEIMYVFILGLKKKSVKEDRLLNLFKNYLNKFQGRETRAQRFMREMEEKLK